MKQLEPPAAPSLNGSRIPAATTPTETEILLRLARGVELQNGLLQRLLERLRERPEAPEAGDSLVPLKEAARRSGRSVASFYRDLSAGRVGPHVQKRGARSFFTPNDLARWAELDYCDRQTWDAIEARKR
jgi:hypothetical protein